jgi:DNA helicase-2/ATP-dependent DNA helicase PcrA
VNDAASFFARKKDELGVSLNEVQMKAVHQTEGPLLLLASPGSGKTTTVIMRVGYLVEVKGVYPHRIKAVTFSQASAADMRNRFKRFFPGLKPVDFSTIHSLAFGVVRDYFQKAGIAFEVIEGDVAEEDQLNESTGRSQLEKGTMLRNIFRSINNEKISEDQFEALTTYISYVKNKMIPEGKWETVACIAPNAARILKEYERIKEHGHAMRLLDYDDMLTVAQRALESDIELLGKYQRRYDYVLTDESQDTSLVQHKIIELLVKSHLNLCVVADDDQSIYSWRGAAPDYLLNFHQVYPTAVVLYMVQNYRSTPNIVDVANTFIKRNKKRYDKNMFTKNPALKPIEIVQLSHHFNQVEHLVQRIQGVENLAEVAVLYRNNTSSVSLLDAFDRAGIPFYMKDADNRFFSHWVVKDVLNFMRLSFNDRRTDIFEKVYNKFNGYISRAQMDALMAIRNNESVFDNLLNSVPLHDYQPKLLTEYKETIQRMKTMTPRHAIFVIRDGLGYEKVLGKLCEKFGYQEDYLLGILGVLEEIAEGLETLLDFANRLKHLEALLKAAKENKGKNAVTFSTLHSSKGLEFERVFMIDLIEGIIPSRDDTKDADLMEEATRLFYVGITRAKNDLSLISYKEREGKETKESLFVTAIQNILKPPDPRPPALKRAPAARSSSYSGSRWSVSDQTGKGKEGAAESSLENIVTYNPRAIRNKALLVFGEYIKHRVFGTGSILRINDDVIHIKFADGEKALEIDTCLNLGVLEIPEQGKVDEIDVSDYVNKLKSYKISGDEAKRLLLYLRDNRNELGNYGLTFTQMRQFVTHALGKIQDSKIRTWLVEIEYLT